MRKTLAAGSAALILGLIAGQGSSAATEIGNKCVGTLLGPNFTYTQLAAKPGGLPVAVPTAGVITTWQVNGPGFAVEEPEYLKILRPTGIPNEFKFVAETGAGVVRPGSNTFPARIAVQAGDHIGAFGTTGTYYCATGPGDVLGSVEKNPVPPMTRTFGQNGSFGLALSATIEPDADNDGYGDETQDGCPQDAQYQIPCPNLSLSFFSLAQKNFALVYVSAGVQSKITVSAKAGKVKLAPLVHLANPGQITKYKLPFNAALKKALKKLPKSKTLGLKIRAEGANAAGVVKFEERTLRLKGQA